MDFLAVDAIANISVTLQNLPANSRCFIEWKTATDSGTSNDAVVDHETGCIVFPVFSVPVELLGLLPTRFLSLLEVSAWFFDETASPPSTPLGSVLCNVAENLTRDLTESNWCVRGFSLRLSVPSILLTLSFRPPEIGVRSWLGPRKCLCSAWLYWLKTNWFPRCANVQLIRFFSCALSKSFRRFISRLHFIFPHPTTFSLSSPLHLTFISS